MKKKILSLLTVAALAAAVSVQAFAAQKSNPDVYVDDALIDFTDQPAVIESDRTLVPARGVFEAMGAKVDWDQETQTVTVNDKTNTIRVQLTLGNPEMEVYTFKSVFGADKEVVTLDVAPKVSNDRTLIPLRAISEAIKADVQWNQEDFRVDITTVDKPATKEGLPTMSLTAPETTVKAGDEFDVYVNISNMEAIPESWIGSVTAYITYDKSKFELVDSYFCNTDGEKIEDTTTNNETLENALKTFAVTINEAAAVKTDGSIVKYTFKALTDDEGTFNLEDIYTLNFGYESTIAIVSSDATISLLAGNTLNVDTTPVVINAK